RQGGCGTRPGRAHTTRLTAGLTRFPASASLGRNPSHGHLYRLRQSESSRLFPQTELRLTCHRCTVLAENPLSSRAARRATRGKTAVSSLRHSQDSVDYRISYRPEFTFAS